MKYICSLIILFLSFSSVHAYRIGDVVMTKEGDLGIVFYIDQEKVLLLSPFEKRASFSTQSRIDECITGNDCDESLQVHLFNGRENTKRMKELAENSSYVFPVLDSIPTDKGWFIPSLAEFSEIIDCLSSVTGMITALNGTPLEEYTYWTSSQYVSDGRGGIYAYTINRGNDSYWKSTLFDIDYAVRYIYQIDLMDEFTDAETNYMWNTGSTEPQITVSPGNTTTYSVSATSKLNACGSTASTTILVAGQSQDIYETICEGETYSGYGFNANTEGTYTKSIGKDNCMSEIKLHLTVAPKYKQVFDDNACLGQYYNRHGFSMTPFVKGEFHDTLTFLSQLGCDSIVILNLNVKPIAYDTITRRICQNERYKDSDFDIEANQKPGLSYYTVEKSQENGCKSYHTLALQVDPIYQVTVMEDMNGEEIAYNQHGFNLEKVTPGSSYRLELSANNGCDSIVTLYFRSTSWEDEKRDTATVRDDRVIPTAFTPHTEDEMNDHFMPGYEVYIYDRYSNLICHSEDGWDGTYRGKVATAGVYIYVVVMKDGEMRKGTIEVVKSK